jgi:DNA-binding Lrp family transcriptional regulator
MENLLESRIDEIDRRILGFLLVDSRLNIAKIANEIQLSKNAVWNRVEKLRESKVITGSTIQLNYKRIGYEAVGDILISIDKTYTEQIIEYLKNRVPNAFGPFPLYSRYNLDFIVTFKKIHELEKLKMEIRSQISLNKIMCMLWTDVWFLPKNFSLIQPPATNESFLSDTQYTLDEVEMQLIEALSKDSQIPFSTLSRQLGISTNTVCRKYSKLIENSIIIPRVTLDFNKLGYTGLASLFLKVSGSKEMDWIISYLTKAPDVVYIFKCEGDFTLKILFFAKSLREVLNLQSSLSKFKGLNTIETSINTINYTWPMPKTYTSTITFDLLPT